MNETRISDIYSNICSGNLLLLYSVENNIILMEKNTKDYFYKCSIKVLKSKLTKAQNF